MPHPPFLDACWWLVEVWGTRPALKRNCSAADSRGPHVAVCVGNMDSVSGEKYEHGIGMQTEMWQIYDLRQHSELWI